MLSHPDDLLTSDLSIWINTSLVFTSNWSIFLTFLLQRMHQNWEWDSFCCKKQLKEFTLRFLHLLQPLLHLDHCLVPLTISWLPASGVFTNFSTLSYSILCKALFTFFLAFLISHLKLTCHFYGFSCSSNSGDFWTALVFFFWIVAQFLPMHLTELLTAFRFLIFHYFQGRTVRTEICKTSENSSLKLDSLYYWVYDHSAAPSPWQLEKTFFIMVTFSLLDTRSKKGSWMNQWLAGIHSAEERNPSS